MGAPPLFVPEGHIDKALTRSLLIYRRDFEAFSSRKQGASAVANELMRQWDTFGTARRVVGMVDNDKKIFDIPYLAEFSHEVAQMQAAEAGHSIRQHPARPSQYLILLDPACDTWLWQAAVGAGLSLASYPVPADRRAFVLYCKNKGKGVGTDPALLQLLADVERARPALFTALAEFVAQVMDLTRPLP